MSATVTRLAALDRALVAHGWPALSPWWRETFARFLASGRRQLVVRAGRRAGKSSSLCRLAVAFALAYDTRQIPPGDVGTIAFVSTTRSEASQRLRTIRAMLDAIGVAWRPTDGGLELVDRPIVFRVFACTIASVSGFTSILVVADEVAKWRDAETGANPATEVLAALRPTMATQPDARIVLSSSPLGPADAHARAFAEGETDHQIVAFAQSWTANPTLNVDQLRRDEPNPAIFDREYGAIPSSGPLRVFSGEHFDRCTVASIDDFRLLGAPIGLCDLSRGAGDAATWCTAAWVASTGQHQPWKTWMWDEDGEPIPLPESAIEVPSVRLLLWSFGAFDGRFCDTISADRLVATIAADLKSTGAHVVAGDQVGSFFAESTFRGHGITYHPIPWTSTNKAEAVTTIRRWLRDRTIAIAAGPQTEALRIELVAFAEKITSSGSFKYEGAGVHDDRVALLLGAAMAEAEGLLSGSPHAPLRHRTELHDYEETTDE